jgi:hypothetical protein
LRLLWHTRYAFYFLCSASLLPLSKRPMPSRQFHHKSRHGCAQCKAKKLKVWDSKHPLVRLRTLWAVGAASSQASHADLLSSAILRDPVHDVSRRGFNASFRRLPGFQVRQSHYTVFALQQLGTYHQISVFMNWSSCTTTRNGCAVPCLGSL